VATPPARVAQVRTAHRAAGADPSQDRTVVLPTAVAVLDGAPAPEAAERDGGWYAEQLAGELADRLGDTGLDLRTVLADSIAAVASAHRLRPGGSSSTVAMLRWSADRAEGLVLGDSSLGRAGGGPGRPADLVGRTGPRGGTGSGAVLDAVRAAETDDPDGRRWPRSKRHDDQSLAVVSWV